jgi:TonB family protein
MTRAGFERSSPNAHLLIGEMPAPAQLAGRWWEGTGLSFAVHILAFGVALYVATHVRQVVETAGHLAAPIPAYVFDRGSTGGGIGSDDSDKPLRRLELPPVRHSQSITPVVQPADTPPVPEIPASPLTDQRVLPGVLTADNSSASPGPGDGPGAGNHRGNGYGDKPGVRVGDGFGDALIPGNGVTSPELVREVRPNYTGDAMRAKVQGTVELEVVVRADGTVDPNRIRITRSLDATFGLDRQAVLAVSQWRFRPGTFKGQPVPVRVLVELTFTLR